MINVVARQGIEKAAPIIVRNWQGSQTLEVDFHKEVNRYGKESGEKESRQEKSCQEESQEGHQEGWQEGWQEEGSKKEKEGRQEVGGP